MHVHTDSESDSGDPSAPDAGNLDDSNDGGHFDQDAELPGEEREDDEVVWNRPGIMLEWRAHRCVWSMSSSAGAS